MLFYHIHKYPSNCPLSKMLYVCVTCSISIIYRGHYTIPGWKSLMKYMVIKWRTIRRTLGVTHKGGSACRVFVWKPEGKGPFWREQTDDNIKVGFTESCLKRVDWIYLTLEREKWRAVVKTIKFFFGFYTMWENSWLVERRIVSQELLSSLGLGSYWHVLITRYC